MSIDEKVNKSLTKKATTKLNLKLLEHIDIFGHTGAYVRKHVQEKQKVIEIFYNNVEYDTTARKLPEYVNVQGANYKITYSLEGSKKR